MQQGPTRLREALLGFAKSRSAQPATLPILQAGRHVLMARRREGRSEANVCEAREEMALARANG